MTYYYTWRVTHTHEHEGCSPIECRGSVLQLSDMIPSCEGPSVSVLEHLKHPPGRPASKEALVLGVDDPPAVHPSFMTIPRPVPSHSCSKDHWSSRPFWYRCQGMAEAMLIFQDAAGSLQLCAGQKSGIEAAVHAMNLSFRDDSSEGVLLVDTSNAFNSLNRQTALRNIRVLCPSIATALINTYCRDAERHYKR